ncbi:MAG: alpha/beta fold hydrolase [Trueperaceae bacterium]
MIKLWQKGSLLVLSIFLLSACGTTPDATQNDDLDILGSYRNQAIAWEPCPPLDINPSFGTEADPLAPLGDRVECATIKAPLNWRNPAAGEVDIGVLRVRAGDPAARKGAILLNMGGPGADGLEAAAAYGLRFSFPTEGTPAADLLKQVSQQYDLVGFSPRGVGGSYQHFCATNELAPPIKFYTDRSEENIEAILTTATLLSEACQRNPVTQHINTEQTAVDMELIRVLMGEKKLNYLGYSYGTWLGAWYAKMFPWNVGNFVLDSNLDFSVTSFFDRAVELRSAAEQEGFEKVVIPYLVRNAAVFELGTTNEGIYSVYETLPVEVKGVVTDPILNDLYNADATPEIGIKLLAAKGLANVYTTTGVTDPEAFIEQLEVYTYASNPDVNAAALDTALQLGEDLQGYLAGTTQPSPVVLDPHNSVFYSVVCNDGEGNKDPNYWVELGNEENIENPISGGFITFQPCASWSKPTAKLPEVPVTSPILMVQAEFDNATATVGALAAFEASPSAKMVFINDEKSHGIFPYGTDCVDRAVAQKLLDGTMPKDKITNCEALPLPGETQVFPADGLTPQAVPQGMKTLPAKEEPTLDDYLHEIIRDNAIRSWNKN